MPPARSAAIPEPPRKRIKTTPQSQSQAKKSQIRDLIFGKASKIAADDPTESSQGDNVQKAVEEECTKHIHQVRAMENDMAALQFWRENMKPFPLLSHVAKSSLAMCMIRYRKEVFWRENIITKKRNRLCNDKVDKLWLIYCNRGEERAQKSPLLSDLHSMNTN